MAGGIPMERKKASDFDPELLRLYDAYVHGGISRRDFLDGAARFAIGGLTAAGLLRQLLPNYALAQQVGDGDARISTGYVTYDSPQGHGQIQAFLARPVGWYNAQGPLPAVVVVHENRGLNPYIVDVARRLATRNFVALAPDGTSPGGGYPRDLDPRDVDAFEEAEARGREIHASLDSARLMEDWVAAYGYLSSDPAIGRVGVTGFCYGGLVSNVLATRIPELGGAVPFYGRQPPLEDVGRIRAPLLIHYAEDDPGVNAGWPAYEEALRSHGVEYEAHVYPGTLHGFHNDTTPRYDEAAATLAWQRTLDFFERTLRG
jgi:carboxymethylenebutenolidase